MRAILGLGLAMLAVATPAYCETADQVQLACERLYYDFATAADGNDPEAVAALFTPDAKFDHGGDVSVGRDAIREDMKRTVARKNGAQSMHVVSNVKITQIDATHAVGTAYIQVYASGPNGAPPAALRGLAVYRDRFLRTSAGWRFAERIMSRIPS